MLHPEAIAASAELFQGHLGQIPIDELSGMLSSGPRLRFSPQLRTVFAGAVVELSALLEEVRFSGALAALLIRDYEVTADGVHESEPEPDELTKLGMPIEALALLSPYLAPLQAPIALFQQPHTPFAGRRVLSLWVAGQLIDSAPVQSGRRA